MTTQENKLEILRRVENGTLTIEEGADLIGMLEKGESSQESTTQSGAEVIDPPPPQEPFEKPETSGCWKAAWSMFLVGGAVLAAFSAYWIYQGYQNHGLSWGFWLSWIPMAIGVGLMALGWALMESPWMNLKVHSKEPNKNVNIVLSMPIPINIVKWVFKNFGHLFSSSLPKEVSAEAILDLLDQAEISIKNGDPFIVQVDDDKDDTKIDISINTK